MGQTIIIFIILAVVFLVLPAVLKRKTGKDFFQLLLGRPLDKKGAKDDAAQNGGSAKAAQAAKGEKKRRNSSKDDILSAVSQVVSFARRNQFQAIIPGALKGKNAETRLPVILVMRSGVVGINMFGYGGEVTGSRTDEEWKQSLNGVSGPVPSPLKATEKQENALREIMSEIGYPDVPVSIINVFTSRDVKITGSGAAEVIHTKSLIPELGKNRYMRTAGVDVRTVGEKLSARIVKAEKGRPAGKRK